MFSDSSVFCLFFSVCFLTRSSGSSIPCCPSVWSSVVSLQFHLHILTLLWLSDRRAHVGPLSYHRNIVCPSESVASSRCSRSVSVQPGYGPVHRPDSPERHLGRDEPRSDALRRQQRPHQPTAGRPLSHALPLDALLQVQEPPTAARRRLNGASKSQHSEL